MKRLIQLLTVLLITSNLWAYENEEFRSIWVVTWDHISGSGTVDEKKARVRGILDEIKQANMNAVLWQVRQSGTAYYRSSYEPWGYYAGYQDPGYDHFAYAVEEAHKRGLEIHAWFNTFQTSSTYSGTIADKHPEWICTNEDGLHMTSRRSVSPGLQDVRDYTINVAMEIVRNYNIDGFHLDYVRWNEYDEDDMKKMATVEEQISALDGHFTEDSMNKLMKPNGSKRYIFDVNHPASGSIPSGFDTWDNWRRWSVTEFVKTLHDSIQAIKPWVRLSPAALGKYKTGGTSGWNGYYIVFQDAALWFNERYIDQLTPMHYHWRTGSSMKSAIQSDWEPEIQKGIAAGSIYSVGPPSYQMVAPYNPVAGTYDCWDNHPGIVSEIRTLDWVDGFQFFSYSSWNSYNYWKEAGETFFYSKCKVRDTKLIVDQTPVAPQLALTKIDSFNYKIDITPADTTTKDHWFALYRSKDSIYNPDTDEIFELHFGHEPFTVIDSYVGEKSFIGRFTYFATMLDRYWNESDTSNHAVADSFPYFINPPDMPLHVYVENVNETTLRVHCDETERADYYVAYISENGTSFSDSAVSVSNKVTFSGLTEHMPYFFKAKAKNSTGSSKTTEKIVGGVPSANGISILVVNGFDRGTNNRHDYVRFYGKPIGDREYGFDYCFNETLLAGRVSLLDYNIVIWVLGDESNDDHTFDPDEQDFVEAFLKQGGHLFVSGAEIGWDLEGKSNHPTQADKDFYHNYLKAQYVYDAPDDKGGVNAIYYTISAIESQMFNGLSDFDFDNGNYGTFDVDWPDAIKGVNGGYNVLMYKDAPSPGNIAAVAFEGTFPGGSADGKLFYLAAPFETVYPENSRIELMSKIFDFFEGKISDIEEIIELPQTYSLKQNYPNPFNPITTIVFTLPQSDKVTLEVFNELGQRVKTLLNGKHQAGEHRIRFDGSRLASGLYFYRIQSGSFSKTRKMLLVR